MAKEKTRTLQEAIDEPHHITQISTVQCDNYGWQLFRLYSDGKVTIQKCNGFKEPGDEEDLTKE